MKKNKYKDIAIEMSLANLQDQKYFLKEYFKRIEHKEEILMYLINLSAPREKWRDMEEWMEKRFTKNYTNTPIKVASMCMRYNKVSPKMMPFFVKMARKVKDRVRKRGV